MKKLFLVCLFLSAGVNALAHRASDSLCEVSAVVYESCSNDCYYDDKSDPRCPPAQCTDTTKYQALMTDIVTGSVQTVRVFSSESAAVRFVQQLPCIYTGE